MHTCIHELNITYLDLEIHYPQQHKKGSLLLIRQKKVLNIKDQTQLYFQVNLLHVNYKFHVDNAQEEKTEMIGLLCLIFQNEFLGLS